MNRCTTLAARAGVNVCLRKVEAAAMVEAIKTHGVTHYCGAPIVHSTLIARRADVFAVGGYRHVPNSEDSDLFWRLGERGAHPAGHARHGAGDDERGPHGFNLPTAGHV